jgi:DNA polymerase III subunit gamma/tau
MDKFIVSARKYRPQTFDTVIGQAHITTTLKNAIKNNQLAHAFLFCGPRGVGKTTCARILAKTINCINLQPNGEACDTCSSCKSFNDGASLNIHELDAASNNSVDDIRTLVDNVRFAPQAGKYKIYIIDEVHMLSSSAFNAFLKTLEEPPSYAIFILATTEKHKILPTILSRCQIFDFKRITNNDTAIHLQEIVDKEHIKADKASLQIIAQKSEGCMRDALSLLDKIVSFTNGEVNYKNTIDNLNILDHDYYFNLLEVLQKQDMANALLLFNEINNKGFEGDTVVNGFAEFIRNILVCKDVHAAKLLDVVEGMQEKYFNVAKAINTSFLISALNILNDTEVNYKMAKNKKLHVELALIKLSFLQQAINLSSDNGSLVKKKRIDSPIAIRYKTIEPIAPKTPQNEAKLYVEQAPIVAKKSIEETATVQDAKMNYSPTLTTIKSEPIQITQTLSKASESIGVKKNLLSLLKERSEGKYIVQEVKESEPLEAEKLNECIANYINYLSQKGGKITTINNLKLAQIDVTDELNFKITLPTLTAAKTIEQEKTELLDLIKKSFNNLAISFAIEIDESEYIPLEVPKFTNARDKYEFLAQQYPMLRKLKETLKLDIS